VMKSFVQHTEASAASLADALRSLDADVRVALTHYAPVAETLGREPREIYPFLGSYLLAEAIDEAGASLALHGHAHLGSESGETPMGVPVRNVAHPVIGQAYRVFTMATEGPPAERSYAR
jgi:Icc-related predicted phosphoesterase